MMNITAKHKVTGKVCDFQFEGISACRKANPDFTQFRMVGYVKKESEAE